MKTLIMSALLMLASTLHASEFSMENLDCRLKVSKGNKDLEAQLVYADTMMGKILATGLKDGKDNYNSIAFGSVAVKNKLIILYVEINQDNFSTEPGEATGSSTLIKGNIVIDRERGNGALIYNTSDLSPNGSDDAIAVICKMK